MPIGAGGRKRRRFPGCKPIVPHRFGEPVFGVNSTPDAEPPQTVAVKNVLLVTLLVARSDAPPVAGKSRWNALR